MTVIGSYRRLARFVPMTGFFSSACGQPAPRLWLILIALMPQRYDERETFRAATGGNRQNLLLTHQGLVPVFGKIRVTRHRGADLLNAPPVITPMDDYFSSQ